MTTDTLVAEAEVPYAYLLKTNTRLRRRVQAVQRQYNVSFNAALHILLVEALDARNIPEKE